MKRLSFALLCLVLLSACSKDKKAEDNMDQMKDQTVKMSNTTDDMSETTETMYEQLRSGDALNIRVTQFRELLDPNVELGNKFVAACAYFKAFEFQLWTGSIGTDDEEARRRYFLEAVNEFTRRLRDIYEDLKLQKMDPSKEGKRHSKQLAFYALAGAMHFNHLYQESQSYRRKLHEKSFYDLVKDAFLKRENGERLEEHELVLLSGKNREMMLELMRARIDILATLALDKLTDKRDMSLGQKSKALLHLVTGGRLGSIELPSTYDESDLPTNSEALRLLDGALKTKNFLKEIHVSHTLNKKLRSAFRHLEFNDDVPANKGLDQTREELEHLINNLLE